MLNQNYVDNVNNREILIEIKMSQNTHERYLLNLNFRLNKLKSLIKKNTIKEIEDD